MGIVGILLAIGTIAILLYAAYVVFFQSNDPIANTKSEEPAVPPDEISTNGFTHENVVIVPFISAETNTATEDKLFENYVAGKFEQKELVTCHRRNGNGVAVAGDGVPNIAYTFQTDFHCVRFAIECQYRKTFSPDNSLSIASHLVDKYHVYQQTQGCPVFVILGVGGKPEEPERLYIIPLNEIPRSQTTIPASFLARYRKFSIKSGFFLHPDLMVLR